MHVIPKRSRERIIDELKRLAETADPDQYRISGPDMDLKIRHLYREHKAGVGIRMPRHVGFHHDEIMVSDTPPITQILKSRGLNWPSIANWFSHRKIPFAIYSLYAAHNRVYGPENPDGKRI